MLLLQKFFEVTSGPGRIWGILLQEIQALEELELLEELKLLQEFGLLRKLNLPEEL